MPIALEVIYYVIYHIYKALSLYVYVYAHAYVYVYVYDSCEAYQGMV